MVVLIVIGLVLLVAIVMLVAYGATRPDQFRVARTVSINAAPETIYSRISDLRRFNEWNPFAKADPSVKIVYGSNGAGPGCSYEWDSKGQAGKGRMIITDVTEPKRVAMSLEFEKPMKANNNVVFALQSQGTMTEVTWEMTGTYSLPHKIMGVIFNMDKLVGGEFAKGLAALKSQVEAQ